MMFAARMVTAMAANPSATRVAIPGRNRPEMALAAAAGGALATVPWDSDEPIELESLRTGGVRMCHHAPCSVCKKAAKVCIGSRFLDGSHPGDHKPHSYI